MFSYIHVHVMYFMYTHVHVHEIAIVMDKITNKMNKQKTNRVKTLSEK